MKSHNLKRVDSENERHALAELLTLSSANCVVIQRPRLPRITLLFSMRRPVDHTNCIAKDPTPETQNYGNETCDTAPMLVYAMLN